MLAGRVARSSSDMVPRVTVATLWIVCTPVYVLAQRTQCYLAVPVAHYSPFFACNSIWKTCHTCCSGGVTFSHWARLIHAARGAKHHPRIRLRIHQDSTRTPATDDSTRGLLGCTTLRCVEWACPATKTHSPLQFQRSHRQTHHTYSAAPAPPRLSRSSSSGWCTLLSVLPWPRPTLTTVRVHCGATPRCCTRQTAQNGTRGTATAPAEAKTTSTCCGHDIYRGNGDYASDSDTVTAHWQTLRKQGADRKTNFRSNSTHSKIAESGFTPSSAKARVPLLLPPSAPTWMVLKPPDSGHGYIVTSAEAVDGGSGVAPFMDCSQDSFLGFDSPAYE